MKSIWASEHLLSKHAWWAETASLNCWRVSTKQFHMGSGFWQAGNTQRLRERRLCEREWNEHICWYSSGCKNERRTPVGLFRSSDSQSGNRLLPVSTLLACPHSFVAIKRHQGIPSGQPHVGPRHSIIIKLGPLTFAIDDPRNLSGKLDQTSRPSRVNQGVRNADSILARSSQQI